MEAGGVAVCHQTCSPADAGYLMHAAYSDAGRCYQPDRIRYPPHAAGYWPTLSSDCAHRCSSAAFHFRFNRFKPILSQIALSARRLARLAKQRVRVDFRLFVGPPDHRNQRKDYAANVRQVSLPSEGIRSANRTAIA